MSLWIANNMGFCVEALCNKRWDLLRLGLYQFGSMTSGAALLNALLKYFVNVTSLDVRQRLTRTVHTSYVDAAASGIAFITYFFFAIPVVTGVRPVCACAAVMAGGAGSSEQIHEGHGVLQGQQGG